MAQARRRTSKIKKDIERKKRDVFERFPLLFTLLATFGLVATLYGFEGLIDKIPVLKDNPIILLTLGVITLFSTGTLYRKLQ